MSNKKLTKEVVFNALGKKKTSPEFIAVLDILGKPIIEDDSDSDIVDYMWDNHGINIVLSYDTGIFLNIFLYPNGAKHDEDYNPDQEPCNVICKENDFDQNLTMQEVREKYGKPDVEKDSYRGYVLLYRNIDDRTMRFVFTNETELYYIMLGQKGI